METMITVARAWTLIKEHVMTLAAVKVNLKEAGGLVLAQDIIASKDVPSFSQSNMDGYTFCFNLTTTILVRARCLRQCLSSQIENQ
jgi:molybdopterin biosynthesis enzyme